MKTIWMCLLLLLPRLAAAHEGHDHAGLIGGVFHQHPAIAVVLPVLALLLAWRLLRPRIEERVRRERAPHDPR